MTREYIVDPARYTQLLMEFLSVDVPAHDADILVRTIIGKWSDNGGYMHEHMILNVIELYDPWWCYADNHIMVLNRPTNEFGMVQSRFIAMIHATLPADTKRVVWSRNHGTVYEPYIHPKPKPPAWMGVILEEQRHGH